MGYWRKVKTNSGHKAGTGGGRWNLRAIVKREAKKIRRKEDKRRIREY